MHAIYYCLRAHSTHVLADQNEDSLFSWNAFIVGHIQLSALNSRCHSSATILYLHQNLCSSPSVSHRPSQGIPICTIFLILLQTGEICLDILKDAWAPVWTLKSAYRNHWLCWITPRPRARSTAVQALLASQSTAIDSSPHAGNLIRCDDRRGFFLRPLGRVFHRVGGALFCFALWNSTPICVADWQSFFSAIWRLYFEGANAWLDVIDHLP